ncbi:thioredoxin family protein [Mesonia sp. K7]|uniref:TlpA family protein disulfide reductase n=1 Tax=Mesonia sp. K7 TaxID=2218606 RepID=UPI000DAA480C|nr:thioredoxin family protein [Mesonia sp. K7]PZD79687.1 thioredoxin [Mesonia sp. K7]
MKRITYLIAFILGFIAFNACKNSAGKKKEQPPKMTENTEMVNKKVEDSTYTGLITEADFRNTKFDDWFSEAYESYQPDTEILVEIKKEIGKYDIKVFMGTWCSDSQREIPHLYKILDDVGYNKENLTVYAMNENKTTEANHEKELNVFNVPTLIFYDKEGNEVNRFVEFPQETLEKDILKIVTKQDYKHSYAE